MKIIKITSQILLLTGLSQLGQWLSHTFSLPLPGNLIGMFLLLFLLFTGLLKETHVKEGADLLLKFMSFFFIPAGVGLLAHLELIQSTWLTWLLTLLATTLIVLISTAKLVDFLIGKAHAHD